MAIAADLFVFEAFVLLEKAWMVGHRYVSHWHHIGLRIMPLTDRAFAKLAGIRLGQKCLGADRFKGIPATRPIGDLDQPVQGFRVSVGNRVIEVREDFFAPVLHHVGNRAKLRLNRWRNTDPPSVIQGLGLSAGLGAPDRIKPLLDVPCVSNQRCCWRARRRAPSCA
jgi:hypothetical protein